MWYIVVNVESKPIDFQGTFSSLREARKVANKLPVGYYIFEFLTTDDPFFKGKTYWYNYSQEGAILWKRAEKPYDIPTRWNVKKLQDEKREGMGVVFVYLLMFGDVMGVFKVCKDCIGYIITAFNSI
jgi:hypothetical protein